MNDLTITLLQHDLAWQDRERNLLAFDDMIRDAERSDIILLPEMFATGFTMDAPGYCEGMDGTVVAWLREKAAERRAHVAGTVIIREEGRYYNRLVWAEPDGEVKSYDKRHLFRMGGENEIFTAGHGNITVKCREWRIRPLICYDLRFPVWSRNRGNEYDLLVYLANWPERRAAHWRVLLQARAIENQAYVAGVNRTGRDGTGAGYAGDSCIIDPRGNDVARLGHDAGIVTAGLSGELLVSSRRDFPVWRDAD